MLIESKEPDREKLREAFLARTACDHSSAEYRIRTLSNGATQINKQCPTCGVCLTQAVSKKNFNAADIARMPPFDTERETARAKEKDDLWYQMTQDESARLLADWRTRYDAYLDSKEWKARRKLVLKRADNICEGCLKAKATEVHHTTYSHVGEEFLFQLVALCEKCHRRYHSDEAPPHQQAS